MNTEAATNKILHDLTLPETFFHFLTKNCILKKYKNYPLKNV